MESDDYKFMRIVDAMASLNQRINLAGVVAEIGIPKNTRGSDAFRSVKIVDASEPSNGYFLHFFAESMDKLPHVENIGDVITVYNVLIKTWDQGSYAQYNKKYSSFAIFEGRDNSNVEPRPYQFSYTYRATNQHKKIIRELRKWWAQHNVDIANGCFAFKDMKEGESVDLLCKILHVSKIEDAAMFFLWDGSDTPPASVESKLEDERDNPLPLQLEPSLLPRDILCTFPCVGTILRMFLDERSDKLGVGFLSSNRWVKLLHVKCEIRAALWCAVLMPFSKFVYLPDDTECVIQCQRSYDMRLKSKWGRMPISSATGLSRITETDHPNVPFVTLMNVLTHPEVTYKFKCVVRVVAIFPWRADDFRAANGIYRVRLTLEDPTARIHAYIYAEDGAKLFGNFTSVEALTKMRNMLLGVADDSADTETNGPRNPPWIQCCLKSYYIDSNNVWGSRNFRIFGTKMVSGFSMPQLPL
ncbi:protection of telomeres protein 1b-like [Andrographis paniculata]|uniref:protection of telomeres protein 1b-like n=1 Tax=Andrographis paniculata TaxID=175694 RepID=UPI0021E6FF8A|nr:protection of telomeres protein 1b-like [Andrographis paniculata]